MVQGKFWEEALGKFWEEALGNQLLFPVQQCEGKHVQTPDQVRFRPDPPRIGYSYCNLSSPTSIIGLESDDRDLPKYCSQRTYQTFLLQLELQQLLFKTTVARFQPLIALDGKGFQVPTAKVAVCIMTALDPYQSFGRAVCSLVYAEGRSCPHHLTSGVVYYPTPVLHPQFRGVV